MLTKSFLRSNEQAKFKRRSWLTTKVLLVGFSMFCWGIPLAFDAGMLAGDLYSRTPEVGLFSILTGRYADN